MSNNLTKGLSILYDMELNNYLMLQTINKLNYEINRLGNKSLINNPKQMQPDSMLDNLRNDFLPVFGFGGGILGAIVGFFKGLFSLPDISLGFQKFIKSIIGLFLIGLVIDIFTIVIVPAIKDKKVAKKYNQSERERYQSELRNDNLRIKQELKQRDILISQRDLLIKKQNESYSKMKRYYDIIGIDRNYRNLIPIGYMYEFCRLGISNKLTGADGLYYLVRQELRSDRLQYSLNEISSKLDTIISNQSRIYSEIRSINSKCNNLLNETKRTAELAARNNQLVSNVVANTSISNYHLQRIQTEAEYQNTMKWIYNKW